MGHTELRQLVVIFQTSLSPAPLVKSHHRNLECTTFSNLHAVWPFKLMRFKPNGKHSLFEPGAQLLRSSTRSIVDLILQKPTTCCQASHYCLLQNLPILQMPNCKDMTVDHCPANFDLVAAVTTITPFSFCWESTAAPMAHARSQELAFAEQDSLEECSFEGLITGTCRQSPRMRLNANCTCQQLISCSGPIKTRFLHSLTVFSLRIELESKEMNHAISLMSSPNSPANCRFAGIRVSRDQARSAVRWAQMSTQTVAQ